VGSISNNEEEKDIYKKDGRGALLGVKTPRKSPTVGQEKSTKDSNCFYTPQKIRHRGRNFFGLNERNCARTSCTDKKKTLCLEDKRWKEALRQPAYVGVSRQAAVTEISSRGKSK